MAPPDQMPMDPVFLVFDVNGDESAVAPAGIEEAAALARTARADGGFLWVGLSDPPPQQMREIGAALGLHSLAVEDSSAGRQQPKIQWFDEHLFIVVWELIPSTDTQQVGIVETFLFARPGLLVSVRRGGASRSTIDLAAIIHAAPMDLARGVMTGLHAIVSRVIDGYLTVSGIIERELEELEEQVFDPSALDDARRLYSLRRTIGKVDRAVSTISVAFENSRDRLSDLATEDESLKPYIQDLVCDLAGVCQLTADQGAALDSVIASHENSVASQQNIDSRKISAVAALLAIPAVIAGLYSTDFSDVPGTQWAFGWLVIVAVIALLEAVAALLLRRRGWL